MGSKVVVSFSSLSLHKNSKAAWEVTSPRPNLFSHQTIIIDASTLFILYIYIYIYIIFEIDQHFI
jgi:hypothetical protein